MRGISDGKITGNKFPFLLSKKIDFEIHNGHSEYEQNFQAFFSEKLAPNFINILVGFSVKSTSKSLWTETVIY